MIEAIDEVNDTAQTEQVENTVVVPEASRANSDSVLLSETAQATLLEQEGLSITEIADELGITTNVVLSDLGIADVTLLAQSQALQP